MFLLTFVFLLIAFHIQKLSFYDRFRVGLGHKLSLRVPYLYRGRFILNDVKPSMMVQCILTCFFLLSFYKLGMNPLCSGWTASPLIAGLLLMSFISRADIHVLHMLIKDTLIMQISQDFYLYL